MISQEHYSKLMEHIEQLAINATDTQLQLIRIEKLFREHMNRQVILVKEIQKSFNDFKIEIDATIKNEISSLKESFDD